MSTNVLSLKRPRPRVVLSLTPLIDVVFILLVFFMLVSQFTNWREIDLIPSAVLGDSTRDQATLTVTLTADGTIQIEGRTMANTREAIGVIKARSLVSEPIVVRPLDGVAIQPVITLMEALAGADVPNVTVERPQSDT
ncbi:biopolymer transporter ExbD [Pyruvatibacter sp.]|uniref:ExbD/TolR family protein n=1 Tax=Pyruvatibacter sp. TaxID=1981328 RepID=UPI0032EED4DA